MRAGFSKLRIATTFACVLLALGEARATSVTVSVDGKAEPWRWVSGGLNDAFKYGVQDGLDPTLVTAGDGFDFSAGGLFTVTYLAGATNAFGGPPSVDADGHTFYAADANPGSSGKYFPSLYIPSGSYPAYLNALVGTFADASGAIVGTPFLLGNGPTIVTAPVGAARLQLGINDDIFGDNTGSLRIRVEGPSAASAVPEPSTFAGLSLALAVGAFARFRRRRVA